ncbi:hypothetical protein AHAS_Ahas14G0131800 [Arachis hypogaea]
MARKGHYTKKPKLGPRCQQPQTTPPTASASHHDDSQILPPSGDSVPATSRQFHPPRSEPRPAPQTKVDDLFVTSGAQSRKGRKTTEFWMVKIIDFDGIIKLVKLSMKEAMERPNSRRIMIKFNNKKQPIGDEVGLLSGILGLLGSEYGKFLICEESWHKITTKDKVYNECVKQIFHFDEDSEGTIKKNILKSMGKSWKDTKLRLYDAYYDPTSTTK